MQKKIVGLDSCNAYVRYEFITDGALTITTATLVSYCTCVAHVIIWSNGATTVQLDGSATCSRTTIDHVKRFYKHLEKEHGARIPCNAYKALHVGYVDHLLDVMADGTYAPRVLVCETAYNDLRGFYERGYLADTPGIFTDNYEPRHAFVNNIFEVKPSHVGAWRVW